MDMLDISDDLGTYSKSISRLGYGLLRFIGIYIRKMGNFRELVNAELLLQFIGNDGCTDANLFVQLPSLKLKIAPAIDFRHQRLKVPSSCRLIS